MPFDLDQLILIKRCWPLYARLRRRPPGYWDWTIGALSANDQADLVVLDASLTPTAVMIGGTWAS